MNLEIKYCDPNALHLSKKNCRVHSDSQVEQIVKSIREFGFTNPVLIDEREQVIAGHGRLAAAKFMKLREVPTITLRGLSDTQKRAYMIADNKLALNASWDKDLLALEVSDLNALHFDLDTVGFDDFEVRGMLGSVPDFAPGSEEDQGRLDSIKPIVCPNCGHEFHKS